MHICMTYLNKGDEVLVPNPGYPTYRSAVKLAGGKCIDYKLREKNNYEPDFDKLAKKGSEESEVDVCELSANANRTITIKRIV